MQFSGFNDVIQPVTSSFGLRPYRADEVFGPCAILQILGVFAEFKTWSGLNPGHLKESHSNVLIGLGTLAVRDYIESYAAPSLNEAGFKDATIETHGPNGRYAGLLYIEKEGFDPLIDATHIAEFFDIAFFPARA